VNGGKKRGVNSIVDTDRCEKLSTAELIDGVACPEGAGGDGVLEGGRREGESGLRGQH